MPELLPPTKKGFKVLATTYGKLSDRSFKELNLAMLDEEAALELLASFVGEERVRGELKEAKVLCANLGYSPFGLGFAGRYLQRQPELSLAATWQQIKWKRLEDKERQRKKLEKIMKESAFDTEKEMSDDRRIVKLFHEYTQYGNPVVESSQDAATEGSSAIVSFILPRVEG